MTTPTRSAPTPVPARTLVVLAALTAVGPFSMDVYTPALPQMATDLGMSTATAQLSLTACLLGLAVGQLIIGPLSDSLGRRPLLLIGIIGWTIGSVLCAVAPGVGLLLVGRVMQGLLGAAGIVVSRAVLSDRNDGPALAKGLALLSTLMAVVPVAAPVIGGIVAAVGGWRADFLVMVGIGVLSSIAVALFVPESLPVRSKRVQVAAVVHGIGTVARRRPVIGTVAAMCGAACAFFAYVSGSTFVVQDILKQSSTIYILMFATNALGSLAAGLIMRRLSGRVAPVFFARIGLCSMLLGAIIALVGALGDTGLVTLWPGLFVFTLGWGFALPGLISTAQQGGRDFGGATSALVGCTQFLFGAIGSPLVGALPSSTPVPFTLVLTIGAAIATVVALTILRPMQKASARARAV